MTVLVGILYIFVVYFHAAENSRDDTSAHDENRKNGIHKQSDKQTLHRSLRDLAARSGSQNRVYLGHHLMLLMACSSTQQRRVSTSWPSSSGLRGSMLKRAWSADFKMVREVLLRPEAGARWPRRRGVFPQKHVFSE
jgi:hypothetical protein